MLFAKTSQTVKQLIASTLLLYRRSLPSIWVISLISAIVVTAINHLQTVAPQVHSEEAGNHWLLLVVAVLSVFVVCYSAIIMMHQIMSKGRDQQVPIGQSIAYAHSRVLKLTLAMVIVYFVTALGMVLFVLPGVFLMTMTSMVMPLIIFKQLGPFESFKVSFELVWGNFWRTLGVIIVPNAVIFVIVTFARLLHLPIEYFALLEVVVMCILGPWVYCAILTMYNELMLLHYTQ